MSSRLRCCICPRIAATSLIHIVCLWDGDEIPHPDEKNIILWEKQASLLWVLLILSLFFFAHSKMPWTVCVTAVVVKPASQYSISQTRGFHPQIRITKPLTLSVWNWNSLRPLPFALITFAKLPRPFRVRLPWACQLRFESISQQKADMWSCSVLSIGGGFTGQLLGLRVIWILSFHFLVNKDKTVRCSAHTFIFTLTVMLMATVICSVFSLGSLPKMQRYFSLPQP